MAAFAGDEGAFAVTEESAQAVAAMADSTKDIVRRSIVVIPASRVSWKHLTRYAADAVLDLCGNGTPADGGGGIRAVILGVGQ